MKKRIFFILFSIILLTFCIIFVNSQSNYKSKSDKVNPEVLRDFNSGDETVKVIIKVKDYSSNKRVAERLEILSEGYKPRSIYRDYIEIEVNKGELEELQKDDNVEMILKSHTLHAFLQQSVVTVNSTVAHNLKVKGFNITGSGQKICIIDTGVDFTHPDLLGRNLTCVIDCVSKTCVENCSVGDDSGHGTHVAGIIGANGGTKGIAPNVSFIAIKILDSAGSGSFLDLAVAIDNCTNRDVSVISMSFGSTELYNSFCDSSYSYLLSSINLAISRNITLVAASGNTLNTTGIASPACIGNVTAVGRINDNDATIIGSRNNLVSLVAPGQTINSTKGSGTSLGDCDSELGNYRTCSGTSMSAPMVSGAFVMIYEFMNRSGYSLNSTLMKSALNSTGKQVYDSSSGLNFSRINVYNAIIALDSTSPNVTLISPSINNISYSGNLSFRCNLTDNLLLKNVTLNIWNSSLILYYNQSSSLTNNNTDFTFNITNISNGNYQWNCYLYDNNSNFAYGSQNFSFFIGNITTIINSPANNSYKNNNQTNFNCTSQTASLFDLDNVTFNLYNATNNGLVYNQTRIISGTTNSSSFNYNFTSQLNYHWNCISYNNLSQFSSSDNYTITYDISSPDITSLISPDDSSSYTSNLETIDFSYNVTDNFGIANCSLIINNATNTTNISVIVNQTNYISSSFSPGTYYWNINCTDNATNIINSSQRFFIVTAPVVESSSGGGSSGSSSGGSASSLTYKINEEDIKSGVNRELKKNDKLIFNLSKNSHSLTVKNMTNNSIGMIIQSSPINITLKISETKKLNLTSKDYYDLLIKLNSISKNKANITIKGINETLDLDIIMFENETGDINSNKPKNTESSEKRRFYSSKLFFSLIGIFIIFLIIVYYINKPKINHKRIKHKVLHK